MSLRINTNVAASNAYRNLSVTTDNMNDALEKLSSGSRINRAADDAAGLAISETLKARIGGLTVAVRNAQDGVSVVQTAEGALNETTSILQRMRDLAVQAANAGAQSSSSRADAQLEFGQLSSELDDISNKTQFNGTNLLDSSFNASFQVGANASDTLNLQITAVSGSTVSFSSAGLGVSAGSLSLSTAASATITLIDSALNAVSTARATLGAVQNRLDHKINNLNVAIENLSASNSRIRDTDMAAEMSNFSKQQILSQAGTAMLAQANQAPQSVLKLLG